MAVLNDYAVDKDNYAKYADVKSILKYGERKGERYDLSFVMPTFKKPDKLKDALESVMNQDRAGLNVEIIIVDNDWFDLAGTDTEKILMRYSKDEIIYFQNENNIGMYGNWNRCLELAKADWVAMLHDDDFLAPDYFINIKKIINTANMDGNLVFVRGNSVVMHKGKTEERNGLPRYVHHTCKSKIIKFNSKDYDIIGPDKIGMLGAPSCGTLMKKEPYLKYGGFDESHSPTSDVYFPERLVTQHGYKAALTLGVLGYARFDDNTSLKESTILGWADEYVIYQAYYKSRSKLAGWLYKHFRNEMGVNQLRYYEDYLMKSDVIVDKEKTHQKLKQIMNYPHNPIKDMIYNKLWWFTYFRIKQLIAYVTT